MKTERNTIFQSADKVSAAWQASYLSYVFCASIMSDKSLSAEKRIEAWRQFQQAMQPPHSSISPHDSDIIKNDLAQIHQMLEERNNAGIDDYLDSRNLTKRYPLGYIIFYTDGRLIYYGRAGVLSFYSGKNLIKFDPELLVVKKGQDDSYCMNKLPIDVNGIPFDGVRDMCVSGAKGAFNAAFIYGALIVVEPLATSTNKAAWLIGIKEWNPLPAPH